ncbi:MAG: hypothetical protein MPJ50_00720 [Pirellulales bacterium]|nr:hypothetical protein [Pirellulales bacterium]
MNHATIIQLLAVWSSSVIVTVAACGLAIAITLIGWKYRRRVVISRRFSDHAIRWLAGLLMLTPGPRQGLANGTVDAPGDPNALGPGNSERQRRGSVTEYESTQNQAADKISTDDVQAAELITENVVRLYRRQSESARGFGDTFGSAKAYLVDPAKNLNAKGQEFADLLANLRATDSPLAKIVTAELNAMASGTSQPPVALTQIIDALEHCQAIGLFDHWWNAYLWRKTEHVSATANKEQLRDAFARIQQQARITDALIQANFEVKPTKFQPRAWMSKAGPPRNLRLTEQVTVVSLLSAAQRAYARNTPTTWQRDAVLRLKLTDNSAPATLWRDGDRITLQPGTTFRFGRLDLLQAGGDIHLQDVQFGTLAIANDEIVTVWMLPSFLEANGATKLDELVEKALHDDDENAARQLEIALPLSHLAIRKGLAAQPDAAGAPRLRLILALFDDAPLAERTRENPQRSELLLKRGDVNAERGAASRGVKDLL